MDPKTSHGMKMVDMVGRIMTGRAGTHMGVGLKDTSENMLLFCSFFWGGRFLKISLGFVKIAYTLGCSPCQ